MNYSDENRFRFASLNITGKFYKPTQLQNVATLGMQITFDKIHFHGHVLGHVRVFPRILLLYLISLVILKIYVILKVIVYIILYINTKG